MEPPTKRCRHCYQNFPALPRLPRKIINKILHLLPFEQHIKIVGPNATVKRRALQKPDWFACYFKYAPNDTTADDEFLKHWNIDRDDPARPHVANLCRFSCPLAAQRYFNECVPRVTALCMLNAPRAASDRVLSDRWCWWWLVSALIKHEASCGRNILPTNARVVCDDFARVVCDDLWLNKNMTIFDASRFQFCAQPDSEVNVTLDDCNITVHICGNCLYRLVI